VKSGSIARPLLVVSLFFLTIFVLSRFVLLSDSGTNPDPLFLARISALFTFPPESIKHLDEPYWMHSTYQYHLAFKQMNISKNAWDGPSLYDQPPLGKYLLGFFLDVLGGRIVEKNGGLMLWEKTACETLWLEPMRSRPDVFNLPSDRRLIAYLEHVTGSAGQEEITPLHERDYILGRMISFFFGLLSAILLAFLCHLIRPGLFTAFLACELFLLNGITVPLFQMVLVDSISCFFILLAIISLVFAFSEKPLFPAGHEPYYTRVFAFFLSGVFIGCALSVKFTAVNIVALVSVLVVPYFIVRGGKKRHSYKMVTLMFLLVFASVGTFLVLNPFLYSDPAGNTARMINHRLMIIQAQSRIPPFHETLETRAWRLLKWGVLLGFNMSPPVAFVYLVVFATGLGYLAKGISGEMANGIIGVFTVVSLWMVLTYLVLGLGMSSSAIRYYVQFSMSSAIIVSIGTAEAYNSVKSFF